MWHSIPWARAHVPMRLFWHIYPCAHNVIIPEGGDTRCKMCKLFGNQLWCRGVLNLTDMEGFGDQVTALMNNAMRKEQLLGVAKIRGVYQGTAVWGVTHTESIYIDFDVQYNVRLTRRLDDTMHTLTIVNLRNTLAIACCSNRLPAQIPQQSSWCPSRPYVSILRSGRNNEGTIYVRDIPIVFVLALKWILYCSIFITHTC